MRLIKTSARNGLKICFCICLSTFNLHLCDAKPTVVHPKTPPSSNKDKKRTKSIKPALNIKSENKSVSNSGKWWQVSSQADNLIDQGKYDLANKMLESILPQAKKEAPESLDYTLTLCRLSTDLYILKKYPEALTRVNEAIEVLHRHQPSVSQRKVLWRSMGTKVAILSAMKKNAEAEDLARKTLAYAIAFPDTATVKQTKIAYSLLSKTLEAQQKADEAKKIKEIMNQQ